MTTELTKAAQQALACMRGLQQHLGPDICAIEADALERALTQRPAAQEVEVDTGPRVLREVFVLCEDTMTKMESESTDFSRGRAFEAKGISRAIGTWFQDEFCGRSHMGEPVIQPAAQAEAHPLASRCYTMSESHLSGYRLVLGFETLEAVNAAQTWVANINKGTQQAAPDHVPDAGNMVQATPDLVSLTSDILIQDRTIYVLNKNGENVWWASVQPGFHDNGIRVSEDQCRAVAADLARLATLQAQPSPEQAHHIQQPYTLTELNERIASNEYSAELLLQHAMLLLNAHPSPEQPAAKCDGNHGGPRCADPECWNDSPEQPAAAGVSDEEIDRAAQIMANDRGYGWPHIPESWKEEFRETARAVLALRPAQQAVPMTYVLELLAAAKSVSLMSVLVDGRECAVPFDQIKRLDAAIKAIAPYEALEVAAHIRPSTPEPVGEPVYLTAAAFVDGRPYTWRDAPKAVYDAHRDEWRRTLYTRPAPGVPEGWRVFRTHDGIDVHTPDGGVCYVEAKATADRRTPEEVLHALCCDLLAAAQAKGGV